jgi:putative phage-type endonuclease
VSAPQGTRYLPDAGGREGWLRQRRRGIGGSDAPVIMGFNRWRSILDLYDEKRSDEPPDTDAPTEAAWWGQTLEPVVADHLESHITGLTGDAGWWLANPLGTLQNTEREFLLANVDRLLFHESTGSAARGIIEIKTVGLRHAGEWGDDGIAMHALWQGIHYMATTGLPAVHYGVLIGGQEFRYRRIDRDEVADLEKELLDAEEEFWECVTTGREPKVRNHHDADALRRLHPFSEPGVSVDLTEVAEQVNLWRQFDSAIKDMTKQRDSIAVVIQQALGDAEAGTVNGEPAVTWKTQTRRALDQSALREEMPEVADKFTKTTSTRFFRVK